MIQYPSRRRPHHLRQSVHNIHTLSYTKKYCHGRRHSSGPQPPNPGYSSMHAYNVSREFCPRLIRVHTILMKFRHRNLSYCGHNCVLTRQPSDMSPFHKNVPDNVPDGADIAHRNFESGARSSRSLEYFMGKVQQMLCVRGRDHRLRHQDFL
jgi:hypothetical protein